MKKRSLVVIFLCLTLSLLIRLEGPSHHAHAASPVNGSTNVNEPEVSPERLFEAVSGYLGSFHRGPLPKTKSRKEQERYAGKRVPQATTVSENSALERERALAERRINRGEWGLAAQSLQRALSSGSAVASAEREKFTELFRNASSKAQASPQRTIDGEFTNSAGVRLVVVDAGEFIMGSTGADVRRFETEWNVEEAILKPETPSHNVRISRPFAIGKYPITVEQFRSYINESGYKTTAERQGWSWIYDDAKKHWAKKAGISWRTTVKLNGDDHPVTHVSHQDAEAYCEWLTKRENRKYVLPTEAQWEFAARGGKSGAVYPWGNTDPDGKKLNIADVSSDLPWADRLMDDGFKRTSPVGAYDPNTFLLYDMVGNVWQFCSDSYDTKAYDGRADTLTTDPTGGSGKKKVVRGGNWAFSAGIARNAFRFGVDPDLTTDFTGFRISALVDESATAAVRHDVLNPEILEQKLARIKELVAAGRRLEARRYIADTFSEASKFKLLPGDVQSFLTSVLDSFVDVSRDNKLQSFTNSLGMELVKIPSGSFIMGSSETDISWAMATLAQGRPANIENEFPVHKVRISRPFHISSTEVTVAQFQTFVDETGYITDAEDEKGGQVFNAKDRRFERKEGATWRNPGWVIQPNQPVTMISYNDATAFAEWLSVKEKLPYKLPTEAQWEYAARGGLAAAQFPWGDELPDGKRANYADKNKDFEWRDRNVDGGYKWVAPVGSYEPNNYGLYDMAGNVLEWVRDHYGEDYYKFSPELDPEGPGHGENRVMKGGEWTFGPLNLRCAFRGWARPDLAFYNSGFRLVVDTAAVQKNFYFNSDFLTKEWVPGPDQRYVAGLEAKQREREARSAPELSSAAAKVEEEEPLVKGLLVFDFSPKSDAAKAGMRRGDVIIEYSGVKDLTADKFLALTAASRKEKGKPSLVFVRDGYQHSIKVSSGFLGISTLETTVKAPRVSPAKPSHDGKDSKGIDWT